MPELADIFIRYGAEYLERFGDKMLPSHKRALYNITMCRTQALGGHLMVCDQHCGHTEYAYHSCKNRACPKCHAKDIRQWVEQRKTELIPFITYFHLVFTLPQELREVVRRNQKKLYSILMQAAAESLMKLAADPKYVGGKLGMLSVLHTWTNAQAYHPHAHFLVPGGGLTAEDIWVESRKKFLVPVKALSLIFRAKFLEKLQNAMPCLTIPKEVWEKEWVVYCKPTVQGSEKVIEYLGRYVHRVAITNNRILSIENGRVTFRYKQTKKYKKKWKNSWRTMTLPALKFITRFLQHVPPKGFHKVRYYGLLSSASRPLLRRIQLLLATDSRVKEVHHPNPEEENINANQSLTCRFCKKGIMVAVQILRPVLATPFPTPARSPP